MTLVKGSRADIIQNHCARYRDNGNGISQWVRNELGLNSGYSMGKWEFMARGQGGGQWMENY